MACFREKADYDKFEFPNIKVPLRPITDFLQENVPDSYYYKSHLKVYNDVKEAVTKHVNTNTVYQYRRYYVRENKNSVCPT
jgi:DNA (cytosine-5)-methyltransferase 1